jgi:hypothetical protein
MKRPWRCEVTKRSVAFLVAFLAVPLVVAQDKGDDALVKSLKEAEVIFMGKVGKVNPLG